LKGYRPSPSWLKERRRQEQTQQVFVPINEVDAAFLDKFLGRIFFWSFTVTKVRPNDQATKFRVCTHKYISPYDVTPRVLNYFPEGTQVNFIRGYSFRHTFDVKTPEPMAWREFIWRVVNALEDKL